MSGGPRSKLVRVVLFPSAGTLLVTLLAVDAALLVAHVLHHTWGGPVSATRWSLMYEEGFATFYGVGKLLGASAALWVLARRTLAPIDLAWSVALVVVAADDLLALHERFGYLLAERAPGGVPFGLDPQVVGELAFWAVAGAGTTALLVAAHRASPPSARTRSVRIGAVVGLLALFSVGVDVVDAFFLDAEALWALVLVEDGGELVVMSLLAAEVARLVLRPAAAPRRARPQLRDGSALRAR